MVLSSVMYVAVRVKQKAMFAGLNVKLMDASGITHAGLLLVPL